MARMICILLFIILLPISSSAGTLPFAFGNNTTDASLVRGDSSGSEYITLPQPMAYFDRNATSLRQFTDGFIGLYTAGPSFVGYVHVYQTDIDTSRGGAVDQNQIWMRTGNRTDDLNIARDIIAGKGVLFSPQAVIVGTWSNVESKPQQPAVGLQRTPTFYGPQSTFQMAMAYSATGETWLILAYEKLQFYRAGSFQQAVVDYTYKGSGMEIITLFRVTSNDIMISVLNGTNCNRTGTYAHRINQGGPTKAPTKAPTTPTKAPTKTPTKAPTKLPTKAPTKAPTPAKCGMLGRSIFCPLTLCGVLGRWVGFCNN